jgi:hypothetical protein
VYQVLRIQDGSSPVTPDPGQYVCAQRRGHHRALQEHSSDTVGARSFGDPEERPFDHFSSVSVERLSKRGEEQWLNVLMLQQASLD